MYGEGISKIGEILDIGVERDIIEKVDHGLVMEVVNLAKVETL